MRVLLGSGGFRTPDRIKVLQKHVRDHFGDISRLLFIPYALHDHDRYVEKLTELGHHAGYRLDGIHRHADPHQAVRDAEAIFIGGGNTFRLLHSLYHFDLLPLLRERVRAGVPFLGVSAGSNMACPTIKTTNDMPIVQPPSFDALGLVPFQINPHYYTGMNFVQSGLQLVEHYSETRDDRIREFHEMNETPVIGLWEAGFLRCEDGRIHLSAAPARIFRKGHPPVDVQPGVELSGMIS